MKIQIQFFKLSMMACAVLVLAGCAGVSKSLDADQISSLRYTDSTVTFAPDASIWWGDGERAYAASKGLPATESETVAKTPEAQAYLRGQITSKMKTAMGRHLSGKLTGSRPVRTEVVVKNVRIASAAQRVLIGGSYTVQGDVNLVDARTGAIIESRPIFASAMAGQGVVQVIAENAFASGDPIDRVIDNFAQNYQFRLLPPSAPPETR
ncbi:MAG TPA: DUF6778 family protein [Pseudolabrys sp.]|jgi:hypothetical protein|nr:DUF6778 family protein [Pseudolabrys sp.]